MKCKNCKYSKLKLRLNKYVSEAYCEKLKITFNEKQYKSFLTCLFYEER